MADERAGVEASMNVKLEEPLNVLVDNIKSSKGAEERLQSNQAKLEVQREISTIELVITKEVFSTVAVLETAEYFEKLAWEALNCHAIF